MTKFFTLFLFLVSFKNFAQNSYPIQTVLKGDSVVIYTTDQSNDLSLTLKNQKSLISNYKKQYENCNNQLDSLKEIVYNQNILIDSLKTLQNKFDTIQNRLNYLENWLVRASVDNSYIYMSWTDSKIKVVDLSIYTVHCNMQNGTLKFIRRGPNSELSYFRMRNYMVRENPKINWNLNYPEESRPIVFDLPISIKINNYIIE